MIINVILFTARNTLLQFCCCIMWILCQSWEWFNSLQAKIIHLILNAQNCIQYYLTDSTILLHSIAPVCLCARYEIREIIAFLFPQNAVKNVAESGEDVNFLS